MNPAKYLVTGSDGMIGRAIPFGVKANRRMLDITQPRDMEKMVALHGVEGILHLAGLDLRTCQSNPEEAVRVNAWANRSIARLAKTLGLHLIFVSSGTVFTGPFGAAFDENAAPSPRNLYGMLKYLSERMIQDSGCDFTVVRTGWVFGGHGAHHRKFVDVAIENARKNEPILGNKSQTGSPTSLEDFVGELKNIIVNDARGIRHVVNSGIATGWDMANEIKSILRSSSLIKEAPAEILGPGQKAIPRSPSEAMKSLFQSLRSWQEALADYVQRQGSPE